VGCTDGTAGPFRLQRHERVEGRTRWFRSVPSPSPPQTRIQRLRPLLPDNDVYIKVRRMVSLSNRQTSKIYGTIASTTINRSRMDAEANDPARVLIHDHQDPVGTQRSRFAPEQIHAPEAVFRVPQESQPGKITRARLGSARVCSMAWWRSGQLTPHRGLLRNEANLVCYGPTAGPPEWFFRGRATSCVRKVRNGSHDAVRFTGITSALHSGGNSVRRKKNCQEPCQGKSRSNSPDS
jgi:hypothetical protein